MHVWISVSSMNRKIPMLVIWAFSNCVLCVYFCLFIKTVLTNLIDIEPISIYFSVAPLGIDFSIGGKYMALAERRDCRDHISIFSCQSWSLVKVSKLLLDSYKFDPFEYAKNGIEMINFDSKGGYSYCPVIKWHVI